MTEHPPALRADAERVWVASVHESDLAPYARAVELSAARIREWNPVHPSDLAGQLERQSSVHRSFVIHARQPIGEHGIVGVVNMFNLVRGRFQSATIGYNSYDPYTGTGMFAEGLRALIGLAFTPEPDGMGLHRIEANVQPANVRSAGLLRSLGFRRERHVRHMLFLEGGGRPPSWRDHDSYAVTAGEALAAYGSNEHPQVVVVVDTRGSAPGIALRVAGELGVPLLPGSLLEPETIWQLLETSSCGAVIELDSTAVPRAAVENGLERAGVRLDRVLLIAPEAASDASAISRIALRARAIALR